MATVFYVGAAEQATLTNTFSVAGVATDPTTISLTVTDPTGDATTYTYAAAQITRTSAGIYTKDLACSEAGTWHYVWTGTGTASDVVAGTWTVFSTDTNKLYCSVEELKSRFKVDDTLDDFELKLAVESVSRWIDGYCDRRFWRGTDTRTYSARGLYCLEVDDLVSVTTLKTDEAGDGTFETTWDTTDYQLLPVNPSAGPETRPYTDLRAVGSRTFPIAYSPMARCDRVQIVGVFGWPAVPAAVNHAALILAAELAKLKDAPFGVAGFGDFGTTRVRQNPKAAMLLAPYQRRPILVG